MAQESAFDSKSDYGRLLRTVVGILALLVFFPVFFGTAQIIAPRSPVRILVVVALFAGEAWLGILIHELGHAAAARLIGWRVHVFSVVPLAFLVKSKRFIAAKRLRTGDYGGFVLATPPVGTDWARGYKTFVLGGVVANLIVSAIAFWLAASGTLGVSAEVIVGSFAVLSLVLGLMNVVPIWGPSTERTDGAHLVDLLRGRRDVVMERLAWLYAMNLEGITPADFDPALVKQIDDDVRERRVPAGVLPLLLAYYLTAGDVIRAHDIVKRIVVTDRSDGMKVEHAFLVSVVERNGQRALAILDAVTPAGRGASYNYWRAMAAARHLAGDGAAARAAVASAWEIAAKTKAPLDDQDRTLLHAIERGEEIPEGLSATVPV